MKMEVLKKNLIDHLDVSAGGNSGSLVAVLALKDCPTILVELDGGDNDVGRVDADGGRSAVRLVAGDTVNVDDPLFAVDLGDLALSALVLAANDKDLVILTDG